MTEWLQYYVVFAISGSLLSIYNIFLPAVCLTRRLEEENIVSRRPVVGSIVWFFLVCIFIPVLMFPIIFPYLQKHFVINLTASFLKTEIK
jgi:hypothetical protein